MFEAFHEVLVQELAEVLVLDATILVLNELHYKGSVSSFRVQALPKEDAQHPLEVSAGHLSRVSHVVDRESLQCRHVVGGLEELLHTA